MSNKIYFTSDLHLCHNKEFLYGGRGFKSIEEHNEAIINNINAVVDWDDELWILGDLMLNDNDTAVQWLRRIKCQNIHVCLGNHDSRARENIYYDKLIYDICVADRFEYAGLTFYVSHMPMKTTNIDDSHKPWYKKPISLCGHLHTKDKWLEIEDGCYHIELDAHDNFPVCIDTIVEDFKERFDKKR